MDVGRNERCPCGSGKKYKHCCIDKSRTIPGRSQGVPNGAQSRVTPGSCDANGSEGRCGKPGAGTMWCKACGKLYAYCARHRANVTSVMHGHVVRVHPETLPKEEFDKLLASKESLSELRRQAEMAPELWKAFFEFVDARQRGEAVHTPMPLDASPATKARGLRERTVRDKGQMVRWYDGAWEFLLSFGMPVSVPTGDLAPMWAFSAKLYPPNRGSIRQDWVDLGRWADAVGVPKDQPEMGDTIRQSPNAVHKWLWMEDAPQEHSN